MANGEQRYCYQQFVDSLVSDTGSRDIFLHITQIQTFFDKLTRP